MSTLTSRIRSFDKTGDKTARAMTDEKDRPKPMIADIDRENRFALHRSGLIKTVLFALGVVSILMLLINGWISSKLIADRLEMMRTVGEIRTQSAIVHIWIEELVTGDLIDRPGIAGSLETSDALFTSLLDAEKEPSFADWYLKDDDEVLTSINDARGHFEQFVELSGTRQSGFDEGGDVGIGSDIDIAYDQIFESLLLELDDLRKAMERRLAKAISLEQTLARSILLAWIAIVALSIGSIWSHERRRREAELALRQSESQLLQAQKMDALGRLAGGIAHDVNNHLAAISMQCEAIKLDKAVPEDVESWVNAIISTADKSATMIKRLLAFSRKQPTLPKVIDANHVVDDLSDILAGLISEDVRLEMRLAPDLANIKMDPSQLEQIVVNLVVNACEAMPAGGRLLIETANCEDGHENGADGRIRLRVSDTGVGIPDDLLDRVFEPFFTTKDMAQNSGLGLATIDGIARQNGGEVRVESRVGDGTTFEVLLPSTELALDAPLSEGSADAPIDEPPRPTILLVEDNDELRTSTGVVLKALGYRIYLAESAETALQLFEERAAEIDVAVVDVIMPGMDGKQLVDEMKRRQPDLSVLFISSYTDDRLSERGIAELEVDFLPKPFSVKDLIAKVDAISARDDGKSRAA